MGVKARAVRMQNALQGRCVTPPNFSRTQAPPLDLLNVKRWRVACHATLVLIWISQTMGISAGWLDPAQ
jgi:hypothetical protein